jgi:hypothetical protein
MINFKSEILLEQFSTEGYLHIKNFYNIDSEILPIQRDIYRLIGIILNSIKEPISRSNFSTETFDDGLQFIVKNHRHLASILYDSLKKLPSYCRLANCEKHQEIAEFLMPGSFVGYANRGFGIRMDHPEEDRFLTHWHQDYVTQLCSPRGIVFWSPLRTVTKEMGPIQLCPKSHVSGIRPISIVGDGSEGLRITNEKTTIGMYDSICAEVSVGDMLILDFLTLHRSTQNASHKTRWAMISRYFDYLNPTSIANGWKGGIQEGISFKTMHPDLVTI